jgi:hypothetical protein
MNTKPALPSPLQASLRARWLRKSLLTAVLALAGSTALFAQYTQTGLYEDNNRRPVPGTGTVALALKVLDRALGLNAGIGYGNYTIRVKNGDSVPPITFLNPTDGTPSDTSFRNLSSAKLKGQTLKIVGIPGPGGAIPTLYLEGAGSMFTLLEGAGMAISIENVTLHGLAQSWETSEWTLPGASAPITIKYDRPSISGHEAYPAENNAALVTVEADNRFEMKGNSKITGNYYADRGGGVFMEGGALTMFDNAAISGNSADCGGGVYMDGGVLTMSGNAAISGNYAVSDGGGVYVDGSGAQLLMEGANAAISRNYADGYDLSGGGGVYVAGSDAQLLMEGENAKISDNYSDKAGGGVNVAGDSMELFMNGKNATISGNTCATGDYGGGGLYIYGDSMTVEMNGEYTAISGNQANGGWGGGVAMSSNNSTFTMAGANTAISNNTAFKGAGGVYMDSGTFTMDGPNATISGNSSGAKGGGVYLTTGSATFIMSRGVIQNNISVHPIHYNITNDSCLGVAIWPAHTTAYIGAEKSVDTKVADTPAGEGGEVSITDSMDIEDASGGISRSIWAVRY